MKKWLFAALGLFVLIALDQATKYLAVEYVMHNGYIPLIGDIFGLQYVENTGAAFGIFKNMQWVFICSTVLVTALMIYFFARMPFFGKYRPAVVLTILLVAGAVGNMIDRVRQGYVVDFLYFKLINFPVFNVADCYVVVAVITFVLLLLFYYKDEDLKTFGERVTPKSKTGNAQKEDPSHE